MKPKRRGEAVPQTAGKSFRRFIFFVNLLYVKIVNNLSGYWLLTCTSHLREYNDNEAPAILRN